MGGGEIAHQLGLLAHPADDAQARAFALHGFDDVFAPASEADNGGIDHDGNVGGVTGSEYKSTVLATLARGQPLDDQIQTVAQPKFMKAQTLTRPSNHHREQASGQ